MIKVICPICGEKQEVTDDLAAEQVKCRTCGELCRVPGQPKPKQVLHPRPSVAKSGETMFLQEKGVAVTDRRFIVSNQTYAMSGVTSVKFFKEPASITPAVIAFILTLVVGWIVFGILGAVCAHVVSDNFSVILALLCFVSPLVLAVLMTVFVMRRQKPRYWIVLATSGAEVRALASANAEFIRRVVQAMNDAIVSRG